MLVRFRNVISKLSIPGPQHCVRLVGGITPNSVGSKHPNTFWSAQLGGEVGSVGSLGTVAFSVKLLGSKKLPPCFLGSCVCSGASCRGSPGSSKSKLFMSSLSAEVEMRIGKPL